MCGERERERDDRKVNLNVKKEREKRVCMCAREIIYEKFFCVCEWVLNKVGENVYWCFCERVTERKVERERQTEMKREGVR